MVNRDSTQLDLSSEVVDDYDTAKATFDDIAADITLNMLFKVFVQHNIE